MRIYGPLRHKSMNVLEFLTLQSLRQIHLEDTRRRAWQRKEFQNQRVMDTNGRHAYRHASSSCIRQRVKENKDGRSAGIYPCASTALLDTNQ